MKRIKKISTAKKGKKNGKVKSTPSLSSGPSSRQLCDLAPLRENVFGICHAETQSFENKKL
jgi:hypothetical protein